MITKNTSKGIVLQSQLLMNLPDIDHFCSTLETIEPAKGIWMPTQIHGAEIVIVDSTIPLNPDIEIQSIEADAVITKEKKKWIGVRTADCVPVLLYDSKASVIGAVHAGWRGTIKHIVSRTIQRMIVDLNCHPQDIFAVVCPSISPEAFEVGEEVATAFVDSGRSDCVKRELFGKRLTKPHVDLWQSNVMDLLDEGVELQNIDCTPWCTFERVGQLYSARREGIGTGRNVSAICLKG